MKNLKFLLVIVLILSMFPLSSSFAGKKNVIYLQDLYYTVERIKDLSEYPWCLKFKDRGEIALFAKGDGLINCNNNLICEERGLNGKLVDIDQCFFLRPDPLDGTKSGVKFRAQTAGQMTKVRVFGWDESKGEASITKQGGDLTFLMNVAAKLNRCGAVYFNLSSININIDHTSAGIILVDVDDLKGSAMLSLSEECLYAKEVDIKILMEGVRSSLITVFDVFEDEDENVASYLQNLNNAADLTSELIDLAGGCRLDQNGCKLNEMCGMLDDITFFIENAQEDAQSLVEKGYVNLSASVKILDSIRNSLYDCDVCWSPRDYEKPKKE